MSAPATHGLMGFGNPLLDISADVPADFLAKYGLTLNNAILAGPEHLPIYAEMVEKFPVSYIAGGATQNTIRVAQWMSGKPGFAAYAGSIGTDAFGDNLKAAAAADGVTTHYYTGSGRPTGTCAVLINEKERSLVANLSAAEKYSKEHFDSAEVQAVVAATPMFYSAGFFLTSSPETMVAVGKHAAESNKIFAMNLSAPFLCQFFKDAMHSVLPYADFVFGNESEAAAYAENNDLKGASVEATALAIAALPKVNTARPRVVIITQGSDATVVASNGEVHTVPVAKLDAAKIVDTNGAGDAMVGGTLAFLAKGASLDDAVVAGHWAAQHILQRSGCAFDHAVQYKPESA